MSDDAPNPAELATVDQLVEELYKRSIAGVIHISFPAPTPDAAEKRRAKRVLRYWGHEYEARGLIETARDWVKEECAEVYHLRNEPEFIITDPEDLAGEEWKRTKGEDEDEEDEDDAD